MPQIEKLTAKQVQSADKKLGDGGGLWLEVKKSGSKSWIYRYRLNGKDREMGLGSLANVPLKKARKLASKNRELVGEGIDPIDYRKKRRA